MFALGAVVAREALADTRVVASSTTRAVTSLCVTVSLENISTGRALHQRAVRATTTQITHTTDMLLGVPGGGVCAGGFGGELLLGEAHSGIGARVGADSTLASNTLVVGEACAFSGAAVAVTLVGALHNGVEVIGSLDMADPSHGLGASALGAISSSPGSLAILAVVASTLVVHTARTMTTAPIGAVGNSHSGKGSKKKSAEHGNC